MLKLLYIYCAILLPFLSEAELLDLNSENLLSVYKNYSKQSEPERLLIEARQKEEGHFFRSFLPKVEASYVKERVYEFGYPYASSSGWNVQGRMSLFNGGRDWIEEGLREARTLKAQSDFNVRNMEVIQQIKKLFWLANYSRLLAQTIEKAIHDNSSISQLAERRIRAGMASSVDRIDFKLNGIRLKQDLQKAKNELRNSENRLRALLMIPEATQIRINQPMVDDHRVLVQIETHKSTMIQNPAIASIQAQADIENKSSQLYSRWYLPKIDFYGGYERPSIRQDDTGGYSNSQWYVGLELKFDLGEIASSVIQSQSKSLEAQAQNQHKINSQLLNQANFEALKENIKSLHELFHDAESSIKEAEGYVSSILKEYERGSKNSIDALNATRQSYEARKEGLSLLRDYKFAVIDFLALTGEENDNYEN